MLAQEYDLHPIKFIHNEKISEVLRSTKNLVSNADNYSTFIGKHKIKTNPNLVNSPDLNAYEYFNSMLFKLVKQSLESYKHYLGIFSY